MPNRIFASYALIVAMAVIPMTSLRLIGVPVAHLEYPFIGISLAMFFAFAIGRPLWLVARRHPSPIKQITNDVRANLGRMATAALLVVALSQTIDAATMIKQNIPYFQAYYADPYLIRFDAVLGFEPWQLTHAVFGTFVTRVFDAFYLVWQLAQILLGVWMVLIRNRAFQLRIAISFQATWLLLGGGLAVLLASVGPCFVKEFYGSDHFAPLMAQVPHDLFSRRAMDWLIRKRGTGTLGSGISAMPSMHVAVSVLAALCVRFRYPRWQWLAWAFVAIIWIGSIHLGWHYASDGIVSAICVLAIWSAAGWLTDRQGLPVEADGPVAHDL